MKLTEPPRPVPPEASAPFAAHLHGVMVGPDLILLDLADDAYLVFPECPDLVVDGTMVHGARETIDALAADGLLCPGAPVERRAPPSLPRACLPDSPVGRPRPSDVALFGVLWLAAARRRPTVRDLSERVRGRSGRRDVPEAIAARVEVFRQLLPLAPWCGACLFQAELLLRFLNAADLDADWVFGVRAWPFLAHCWLQIDDVAISQSPETLTLYRPILVL